MGGFASPVARQAVSGTGFRRCDLEQRERVTLGQTDRVAEARLEDFPV